MLQNESINPDLFSDVCLDGQAFTGPWGRPQRDGPALRSIALISYANWLWDRNSTHVTSKLWPVIQLDLDYVVKYWNESTYVGPSASSISYTQYMRIYAFISVSIYGRKSLHPPSIPLLCNTEPYVKALPLPLPLAILPRRNYTPSKQITCCASCRSVQQTNPDSNSPQ
jgi:hypothetical protein